MSDYEGDEMDVDAPVRTEEISFSANGASKGKRSAANLPVECEDNLPWYIYS
jgi:replication factor C subunit 3/5